MSITFSASLDYLSWVIDSNPCGLLPFTLCAFFFFFFLELHPRHMKVPRLGVELEPQPQACQIRAVSVTFTTAHSNEGCLAHWTRKAWDQTCILMDTSLGLLLLKRSISLSSVSVYHYWTFPLRLMLFVPSLRLVFLLSSHKDIFLCYLLETLLFYFLFVIRLGINFFFLW